MHPSWQSHLGIRTGHSSNGLNRLNNLTNLDILPGDTKGEVSLYCWPPVWLFCNYLYDNWQFLFLFTKQTNPNQSNRWSMVQWYLPFSIPWFYHLLHFRHCHQIPIFTSIKPVFSDNPYKGCFLKAFCVLSKQHYKLHLLLWVYMIVYYCGEPLLKT